MKKILLGTLCLFFIFVPEFAYAKRCPDPTTTTTACPTCEPCEDCEECQECRECPTCPDCSQCPSVKCPDVTCPEIPDCICEAPEIPTCPDVTCPDPCQEMPNVDMSGTWDMVGLMAATGIETDGVWGTITISSKDGKLGWGYQCLVRSVFNYEGVGCMTYLLRKR